MTRADLVRMNKSLLKVMSDCGIKVSDVLLIDMYDDFIKLRKTNKFSVVISTLAEKYKLGERTVSRAVARLQKEVDKMS